MTLHPTKTVRATNGVKVCSQNDIPLSGRGMQGTAIRNRLAVRIAGSHPADRGSIPRYGSNHCGLR